MARTPADAALLLQAIAGLDAADTATQDVPLGDLDAALARGLEGRVVGLCPDLHLVALDPAVQAAFDRASETAAACGARLEEVTLPEAASVWETFGATQRAEALFTHTEAGLYPSRAAEYGPDVRGRLEQAAAEGVADYLRAAEARTRLRAGFARVFREVDLLLTPVSAGSPVPIGEDTLVHGGETIGFRDLVMPYTTPQDLCGLPACALRAGFDALGIPVGVQLTGPPWAEAEVLGAAEALFSATPEIQERWPDLAPSSDERSAT
jgi:aspartyl-tRNA(Asn)/glutamyl-tRNA(Gln) amidotransferase subunit A